MQQQPIDLAVDTENMVLNLHSDEDRKLTMHDLVVVAEQSLAALGACGVLHHFM